MNAPILYPAGTTDFTSNGLGRLSDAISCRIQENENGLFELSMVYPVDGIHLSDITYSRIIYARHVDGPQPFEVYRISKPLNGKVEISAQHATYGLAMIPAFPGSAASAAGAMALLESNTDTIVGAGSPYVFWTDIVSAANFTIDQPTSVRALLGGQEGSILDTYGGQYEWDHYTVKLHAQRGHDSGVTIMYGKNLLDLTQEENIQNTYTGIAPFWSGFDSNQEPVLVTLPEKVRTSSNASNFPYPRIIPVDFSSKFESQPTEAQLRTAADAYISDNGIGVPAVSMQVSFVDLWKTEEYKDIAPVEKVRMCDIVTVKFDGLGVSASARVVETDWDVLLGRYNSVTVGDARSTLASSIRSSIDAVREDIAATKRETAAADAALQAAVDHATQMLTTGLGGYVVFKLNANGQPEELLVLGDSPDYEQAQQVWRWNRNGLGYSGHGYNPQPPYGYAVALTADGQINADRITTGSLDASIITSGIIRSRNGSVYFDLTGNRLVCSEMRSTNTNFETYQTCVILEESQNQRGTIRFFSEYHQGEVTTTKEIVKIKKSQGDPVYICAPAGTLYLCGGDIDTSVLNPSLSCGRICVDGYTVSITAKNGAPFEVKSSEVDARGLDFRTDTVKAPSIYVTTVRPDPGNAYTNRIDIYGNLYIHGSVTYVN